MRLMQGLTNVGKKETPYERAEERVAQLLQQINLKYEAATRGLTGSSAGSAKHSFITARLEQIGVYHEQLAGVITKLSRYCKKKLSRVQYNIDVVKRTPKQQV